MAVIFTRHRSATLQGTRSAFSYTRGHRLSLEARQKWQREFAPELKHPDRIE